MKFKSVFKATGTSDKAERLLILDSMFDSAWEMHWCKLNISNNVYTNGEAWVTEDEPLNVWAETLSQG